MQSHSNITLFLHISFWRHLKSYCEYEVKVFFMCRPDAAKTDDPLPTDPADLPSHRTDKMRTEFVRRGPGPYQVTPETMFPRRDEERSCHHQYFSRTFVNGERIKRSWVTCSKKLSTFLCKTNSFTKWRTVWLETCKCCFEQP